MVVIPKEGGDRRSHDPNTPVNKTDANLTDRITKFKNVIN